MTAAGEALARAAASFTGVPFRLYGRSREGVDCVGLLLCSLAQCGRTPPAPRGYGLRNLHPDRHFSCLAEAGFAPLPAGVDRSPGDVLVVTPGPAQQHLLIALDAESYIHAHAGLRRVVVSPGPVMWQLLHCWRLPSCKG